MKSNYSKDIYKQLEETLQRLDEAEREHKEDLKKQLQKQAQRYEKQLRSKDEKIAELRGTVEQLTKTVEQLTRTVEAQNEKIDKLLEEVTKLRSKDDNNSSNSSLPPSTDQRKSANTYNGRKNSGKKKGGQKGHAGKTLTRKDIQEKIDSGELEPEIKVIGSGRGEYITKYVLDLRVSTSVVEYRIYRNEDGRYPVPKFLKSDVTYGPQLQSLILALYSEGVVSNKRIRNLIEELSHGKLKIADGTVYNTCRRFSDRIDEEIQIIETELLGSDVLYTDGTVVTMNGHQYNIRNASTKEAVRYMALGKKDLKTLTGTMLADYVGIMVHDHETAMYHFGTKHAECNVHLLRYLNKNKEDSGNDWGEELAKLLLEIKEKRLSGLGAEQIADYETQYDEIIAKGREQNKQTAPKWAKQDENALLNRLEKYRSSYLLFMYDPKAPFDNNLSERDLRKCKNRQKISGGFREQTGADMFCRILSFVETCKKKGKDLFYAIEEILGKDYALA